MPDILPVLTRTIDNAFTHTWEEIRPEAIDNILNATVIWSILNAAGSFTPQVGGNLIQRTILHGMQPAVEITRGSILPQGEPQLETMAIFRMRALASHVQRSLFDDQSNNGPAKIKDLVATKLAAARDGLEQLLESSVFNPFDPTETSPRLQGLNDIVPPKSNRTTGTYGGITRPSAYIALPNGVEVPDPNGTNPWWGPKYLTASAATIEDNLLTSMKNLYNSIHNNQSPPNLIVTSQQVFQIYEEFAVDMSQIIKDETTRLADLGFEVLRFKGKPLVWVPQMDTPGGYQMLMLNTDFIEVVYDPAFWFQMTEWKPVPLQQERIAHIVCFVNMLTTQPRRHGRLVWE